MSDAEASTADVETAASLRISWVWIVPLLVVSFAAWTIYQSYRERGIAIDILFPQGKGIEAGKTEIRYKDVVVGTVESLSLSEDLKGVVASALLDRRLEPYLGDTTDFWVVTANISGTSLRGLSTLLSGAYIEVDWSGVAQQRRTEFEGLLEPPLTPPSTAGRHFMLISADASSLSVGSPVVYRGFRVGQVERRSLTEDYRSTEYELFVEAPYDSLISTATRFYDVSGVSLNVTGEGLELEIASLQTLAAGGVTFYTPERAAVLEPAADDRRFNLFATRSAAEESWFEAPDAEHYYFSAIFKDSVEGLDPGAPVSLHGMRVGTVVDVVLDPGTQPGDGSVIVVLDLQPARVGRDYVDMDQGLQDVADWVRAGMRVQLVTGNLLTGKKRLNIVELPDSPPVEIDLAAKPYPILPTATSQFNTVTDDVGELVRSLSSLPYDELLSSAILLLDNASGLLGSDAAKGLPANFERSLASIDKLAGELSSTAREGEATLAGLSPDSALYIELSRTVRELRTAAQSVTALVTLLEEDPNALITGRR